MIYCLLEVKKLLREKLFLIFIVLCLCLNIGLCFSDPGTRSAVNSLAQNGDLSEGKKIYDTLDTNVIGSFYYNERYIKSSLLNQWIKAKYEKLQQSVDLLDAEDADLSYFAGEVTSSVHEALFVYQLKTLMIECVILLSLLGIRSFEIEQQREMAALIYSSGRGRKIAKDKILANGIIGALYCLILISVSLAVFFAGWDFSRLWDANMASSFHYVIDSDDPIFGKPFLTWQSFTLKRYFVCTLVLMAGVLLAWWLLTNLIVLLARNIRYGWMALAAVICLPFFGLILFSELYLPRLFYLDTLTLPVVIYCNQWWFTDLGNYSLFAYQEVWTVTLHLLLLAGGLMVGLYYFKRKELA